MHWNRWIRQSHTWLSVAFTLTVVINFAVRTQGEPPAWVTYSPLPALFLMLLSGLYMLVVPYIRPLGAARRTRAEDRNVDAAVMGGCRGTQ